MTPLPKKKHTRARSNRRRSAKKASLPTVVKCLSCGELKYPHKACPSCGKK